MLRSGFMGTQKRKTMTPFQSHRSIVEILNFWKVKVFSRERVHLNGNKLKMDVEEYV